MEQDEKSFSSKTQNTVSVNDLYKEAKEKHYGLGRNRYSRKRTKRAIKALNKGFFI